MRQASLPNGDSAARRLGEGRGHGWEQVLLLDEHRGDRAGILHQAVSGVVRTGIAADREPQKVTPRVGTVMPEGWTADFDANGDKFYVDPNDNLQWDKPPGTSIFRADSSGCTLELEWPQFFCSLFSSSSSLDTAVNLTLDSVSRMEPLKPRVPRRLARSTRRTHGDWPRAFLHSVADSPWSTQSRSP